MAQPTIHTSFASGEWAPKLRSRVDIQKYKAGAAYLRNFYVDYSGGGASTRPGTQFINQVFNSSTPVRLVPFRPGTNLSYVLEFGDGYIRFYSNGAPILEDPIAVTGASGNTITTASNTYVAGDWVFYNNAYYIVLAPGAAFTVTDLRGVTPTLSFSGTPNVARVYTLTSPFAATDLFPNPLTGNPGIKYAQDVTSLIICHPSYQPQVLTINAPANWTISTINFGPTIATPTNLALVTTLSTNPNSWDYAYTVTAVDFNGQESPAPTPVVLNNYKSLSDSSNPGTNTLSWNAVPGAQSYNVYKASPVYNTTFPATIPVGFIANILGVTFTDATPGFAPDFSQTPPIGQNPFQGAGVQSYNVTAAGTYTTVPTVTIAAPPAGGYQATANAALSVLTVSGSGGQVATNGQNPTNSYLLYPDGVTMKINSVSFISAANGRYLWGSVSATLANTGSLTGAGTAVPTNPVHATKCSVAGFQDFNGNNPGRTFTWGVGQVLAVAQGAGYDTPPAVTFSSGAATATANLNTFTGGNPGVPEFFQERLCLAAQAHAVQAVNLSQPGSFFNFNTTFPVEDDDAIVTQIISSDLNDIKSLTNVPTGLLALTSKAGWLINGGGGIATSAPITPTNITAQAQAFNGANDLQPLKINMDVLYSTKSNYVRDLSYNIYATIFTGADISVLSNHLFFDFYLVQWCWSEEPFKTVWVIRNDGTLLSLAYVKEQELAGWSHHDTDGQFLSVCSVPETTPNGDIVDMVYFVVQRQLPNGTFVQYVERLSTRYFIYGYEDAWSVDCALQTNPALPFPSGTPLGPLNVTGNASVVGNTVTLTDSIGGQFTSGMVNSVVRAGGGKYKITAFTSSSVVTATVQQVPSTINPYTGVPPPVSYTVWTPVTVVGGLTQLIGRQVTGVADGAVVPLTTVSSTGTVTLAQAATKVTLGLPFLPQLQTLPLDLGEPTVQSKRKKVPAATMRVADTLGLQIGTTFANAVTVKDFQIGAIPTQSNGPAQVTDLYSGDGRQILDQVWQEPGQLCIQQSLPYPATILGIMPEVAVGDTPSARPAQ